MTSTGKRALRGVRLSKYRGDDDPTTSPARQIATIDRYIDDNGLLAVGTALDLDESAYKLSPFARPALGDWLEYRKNEFDIIVWSTLDRAVRRMSDMSTLARYAKENGKSLVFCSGPSGGALVIDMSSANPVAELIAQVLAFAAEMEAFNDRERTIGARAYLRQVSRYAGGWTPFGYRPVSLGKGKGYALEHDPQTAPILLRMVDDVLAGKGPTEISNWLDAENIPTSKDILRIRQGKEPAGLRWHYPAVLNILRSHAVCGITEIDGKIVYGDDGLPVRFAEPIIDDATWDRMQKALDRLSRPVNRRRKDSPWLTGVSFCKSCGLPLHGKRQTNKGKLYEYMCCDARRERRQCSSREIRQERLEAEIDKVISNAEWSGLPYLETRTIEGRNHAPEMATIKAAIKDIAGDAEVKEAMGESAESERTRVDILKSRLANLRNMPDEPDRIVFVQTGESVWQHWNSLSGAGRNAMLVSHSARVLAEKADTGLIVEIDPGTLAYPPVWQQA